MTTVSCGRSLAPVLDLFLKRPPVPSHCSHCIAKKKKKSLTWSTKMKPSEGGFLLALQSHLSCRYSLGSGFSKPSVPRLSQKLWPLLWVMLSFPFPKLIFTLSSNFIKWVPCQRKTWFSWPGQNLGPPSPPHHLWILQALHFFHLLTFNYVQMIADCWIWVSNFHHSPWPLSKYLVSISIAFSLHHL